MVCQNQVIDGHPLAGDQAGGQKVMFPFERPLVQVTGLQNLQVHFEPGFLKHGRGYLGHPPVAGDIKSEENNFQRLPALFPISLSNPSSLPPPASAWP